MKRINYLTLLVIIVPLTLLGWRFNVQAGDWLSTIAEAFYGDPLAYTVIVDATNLAVRHDPTYTAITNPASIEIGAQLCIPDQTDGTALLVRQAAMQQGESAVEIGKMLLIVGNRSQQQMAAVFILSGGQFETPQSFDIPAGHEVQLQLVPGDYQIQWSPGQCHLPQRSDNNRPVILGNQ